MHGWIQKTIRLLTTLKPETLKTTGKPANGVFTDNIGLGIRAIYDRSMLGSRSAMRNDPPDFDLRSPSV
jgi:hypothetical protein